MLLLIHAAIGVAVRAATPFTDEWGQWNSGSPSGQSCANDRPRRSTDLLAHAYAHLYIVAFFFQKCNLFKVVTQLAMRMISCCWSSNGRGTLDKTMITQRCTDSGLLGTAPQGRSVALCNADYIIIIVFKNHNRLQP